MKRRTRLVAVFCLLAVLCAALFFGGCRRALDAAFSVTVFDVGQGDCILISCDGETMLIDAASATARAEVRRGLRRQDVRRLDTLLLTHAHEDHIANAYTVLDWYGADRLLLPAVETEGLALSAALDSADRAKTEVVRVADTYEFSLGSAACTVWLPISDAADLNNSCLVLRVIYGKTVWLFMGDAEAAAEQVLLEAVGAGLDCNFLKVGHHGSKTGTTEAFLAAATPSVAAISCAADNDYGMPHTPVLERLAAIGTVVYRTDERGTLTFVSDGEEVRLWEN